MAGIGFELRKAIKEENRLHVVEGYISAAFAASGTIIIGILIVSFIQISANYSEVEKEVQDRFMCYVTITMFISMLVASCFTMVISRFAADKIYLGQYQKIMPSFVGASVCAILFGVIVFSIFIYDAQISYPDFFFLEFLYIVLINCWLLMGYISLVRNYRKVVLAYMLALSISCFLIFLFFITKKISLYTMLFTLIMAYVLVDIVLFSTLYQKFSKQDNSIMDFWGYFKRYPSLPIIGFCCMFGMLGHFFVDWKYSSQASVIGGIFRFDASYDFPAILAYCSTIPAMCYFIIFFETSFEKTYTTYFRLLGNGGKRDVIDRAHHEMISTISKCLWKVLLIQLISCLTFLTIVAKLLAILNIGMTTDMLNGFRIFCVGFSFYEIGNILILLNLYFLNDNAVALPSIFFMFLSIVLSYAMVDYRVSGLGFSIASFILMLSVGVLLARCLLYLEEHILLRQPILIQTKRKRRSLDARKWNKIQRKKFLKRLGECLAVCLCVLICMQINIQQKNLKITTYTPEASDAVVISPLMGLAPYANSEETLDLETSLVYVEIKWSDWEPEEGVYNLEKINNENYLDTYRAEGRNVVLRFICDEPTEEEHIDIPQWLYEEINGDGQWYDTSYGKGFSPNYENEIIIEKHKQAIAALGAALGSDDFVCYVELGSLGHWGEWHTNIDEGVQGMPTQSVRAQYVEPYLSAFPNAQFLLRYPLVEATTYDMGLYNDMTGDYEETMYWFQQMREGGIWEQTGDEDQVVCADVWQTNVIGGEFASTYSGSYFLKDEFSTTIELLESSHQSFIGPKIIIDEDEENYETEINEILCTIGYRYRVSTVEVDLSDSDYIKITANFINDGIAPIYKHFDIIFFLYDENGDVVAVSEESDLLLEEVLPDVEKSTMVTFEIGDLDDEATYCLGVAVVDEDGEPYIPLALTDEIETMIYNLASFTLK